jgi:hypothetical protein
VRSTDRKDRQTDKDRQRQKTGKRDRYLCPFTYTCSVHTHSRGFEGHMNGHSHQEPRTSPNHRTCLRPDSSDCNPFVDKGNPSNTHCSHNRRNICYPSLRSCTCYTNSSLARSFQMVPKTQLIADVITDVICVLEKRVGRFIFQI